MHSCNSCKPERQYYNTSQSTHFPKSCRPTLMANFSETSLLCKFASAFVRLFMYSSTCAAWPHVRMRLNGLKIPNYFISAPFYSKSWIWNPSRFNGLNFIGRTLEETFAYVTLENFCLTMSFAGRDSTSRTTPTSPCTASPAATTGPTPTSPWRGASTQKVIGRSLPGIGSWVTLY